MSNQIAPGISANLYSALLRNGMRYLICTAMLLLSLTSEAQVAINQDSSSPDSSAILDLSSTTKGLLIPRMTTLQREAIDAPATGLMVYDLDLDKFYCQAGGAWIELMSGYVTLISDADADTKVEVESNADEDTIRFIVDGAEVARLDNKTFHLEAPGQSMFIGKDAGRDDTSSLGQNTFVGYESGRSNTIGRFNTASGYQSLYANKIGSHNTVYGYQAMYSLNSDGWANVAVGHQALYSDSTGSTNVAVGYRALYGNQFGSSNVAIGFKTLEKNTTGYSNVAMGVSALSSNKEGYSNVASGNGALAFNTMGIGNIGIGQAANFANRSGNYNTIIGYRAGGGGFTHSKSGNVFLGNYAGYNEQGDNRLYIENTDTNAALIYGEFDANLVRINGKLEVTGGMAGFSDTDGDTKIQLESTPDEDVIRFDLGGTEYFVMDGPRLEVFGSGASVFIGNGAGENDDLTNNSNVFIGKDAGLNNSSGFGNVAMGNLALNFNNTANNNVALGFNSLSSNTASNMTAVGSESLSSNTSGGSNNAFGRKALYANTTGFHNTAIGVDALLSNTDGQYNVALGNRALQDNLTGTRNVAIGHVALRDATGSRNVAVGVDAGQQNTGNYNVFMGFESGLQNVGSSNVFLGFRSGKYASGSDKLYIDNSSTNSPLIYGEFLDNELVINGELGIGQLNPAHPIHLASGAHCTVGGVWTNASDISKKKNIHSLSYGLDEIMAMDPKMYKYKIDGSSSIGFIAQEMEAIIPEVVSGEDGEKGIAYGLLTSVLVQGIQELSDKNQSQQAIIDNLLKRQMELLSVTDDLMSLTRTMRARIDALENNQRSFPNK